MKVTDEKFPRIMHGTHILNYPIDFTKGKTPKGKVRAFDQNMSLKANYRYFLLVSTINMDIPIHYATTTIELEYMKLASTRRLSKGRIIGFNPYDVIKEEIEEGLISIPITELDLQYAEWKALSLEPSRYEVGIFTEPLYKPADDSEYSKMFEFNQIVKAKTSNEYDYRFNRYLPLSSVEYSTEYYKQSQYKTNRRVLVEGLVENILYAESNDFIKTKETRKIKITDNRLRVNAILKKIFGFSFEDLYIKHWTRGTRMLDVLYDCECLYYADLIETVHKSFDFMPSLK